MDLNYEDFRCDDSDNGIITVFGPRIKDSKPPEYDVQLRIAIRRNERGKLEDVSHKRFVQCYISSFTFYLQKHDFLIRVSGDIQTYERDWVSGRRGGLCCEAWDVNAKRIGDDEVETWPHTGLIPNASGNADRLALQTSIWQRIAATTKTSTQIGRLWSPRDQIEPPLKVYFEPLDDWHSEAEWKAIIKQLKGDYDSKSPTWLDLLVLQRGDITIKRNKLIRISENLLSFYATYMPIEDFKRLVKEQTRGRTVESGTWMLDFPLYFESKAADFHKAIKIPKGLRSSSTTTHLFATEPAPKNFIAESVTGGKSANMWAKSILWENEKNKVKHVAEWLQRSAPELSRMGGENAPSWDNIVFGTYEANCAMLRAKAVIQLVLGSPSALKSSGRRGTLITRIINCGSLDIINCEGKKESVPIPPWLSKKNYSWLAPELQYKGKFEFASPHTARHWDTRFYTFSCYSPLTVEGTLDRTLCKKWLAQIAPDPESPGLSFSKTPKAGIPVRTSMLSLMTTNLNAPYHHITNSREFMTHPLHQNAWDAASKQLDSVMLGNTSITHPVVKQATLRDCTRHTTDPYPLTPPASGFVLAGDIQLFGSAHSAKFESWHGPTPLGVVVRSNVPFYQHAIIGQIHLPELFPLLAETPFKDFALQNVIFTYQNCVFEKTKPIGWSMTAEIFIDEHYGILHKIFTKVLCIPGNLLTVQVSASLGFGLSWTCLSSISSISIEGIIQLSYDVAEGEPYKGLRLCDDVMLSRIGIRLFGVRSGTFGLDEETKMDYGFSVFGDLNLVIPATEMPLEFKFEISEVDDGALIDASIKSEVWSNAFGLGVNLELVAISASFAVEEPLKSLSFNIEALLRADSASAVFAGTYSSGGKYILSATVPDFGCAGIVDLFRHCTGGELAVPTNVDITIGSATITISNGTSLTVTVDKLEFDNYMSTSAKVELSANGVLIHGKVDDLRFPGLLLSNPFIQASFEKVGAPKLTDVALGGEVHFVGIDEVPKISAAVHLYKASGESQSLDWTVYGIFPDLGSTTHLGHLFREFKGTFLERLELQELAFIAASQDDPVLHSLNPQKYDIHKGIQICAVLGNINPLHKLLRRPSPGLILSAGWSNEDNGFSLDVGIDTRIHLGRGITTDPIELQIQNQPEVRLAIEAALQVPVPRSEIPLDFRISLTLDDESVKVVGAMDRWWKDPFGISNQVAIGPVLALELEINLLLFFLTGLPLSDGLSIGQVKGNVALEISEDPLRELLTGKLKHLGIRDIISFVRDITGLKIPIPPDFISFVDVELYVSTGLTIGTTPYPQGFSFKAMMNIFDIKGHDGKDVMLDLALGEEIQMLRVDGEIRLFDFDVALLLNLEILPSPKFKFDFVLHFTRLLTFEVDAEMIGGIADLEDLSGLDFVLHAHFDQHVLDYVRRSIIHSLEFAKKRTIEAIEEAKMKISIEEKKIQAGIEAAQSKLDMDYRSWIRHSKGIHEASQSVIGGYMMELKKLQDGIDIKRQEFNLELKSAEGKVEFANANRADKMRAAEAAVTKAKSDWDNEVEKLERKLEDAKATLNSTFGHAERDVEIAEANVDRIQDQIDNVRITISDYEDAHWYEFWKKASIPALYIELGAIEGSKAIADGVLSACHAVLKEEQYLLVKGVIPLVEEELAAVQLTGDELFNAAVESSKYVDKVTSDAVVTAKQVLEAIKMGGDARWRAAEASLNEFVNSQKVVLVAAQKAIDDLVHSLEWLAYQEAKAALNVAEHATHALDVAKCALDLVENGEKAIIDIAEGVINAGTQMLNITKIELVGTLRVLLGGGQTHFVTSVEGEVLHRRFHFDNVELSLDNTAQFTHDIFVRVLDELKRIDEDRDDWVVIENSLGE